MMDRRVNVITDNKGIIHTFVAHFKEKYGPIKVDGICVNNLMDTVTTTDAPAYAATFEQPITLDEIVKALKTGGRNKTPGSDGISLEFYTAH